MPNNLFPFLFGDSQDGIIRNQDFMDVLFFFLAAMSLCAYSEKQSNPDYRNDEMLSIIMKKLEEIEEKQKYIIDILEKK